MTRILHLTDLHFGLHRVALVGPLLGLVNGCGADLVVVTGDLTHRGRAAQFRQAAGFLAAIAVPLLVVPGNHDVPLGNLPLRLLGPYTAWRQVLGRDLAPSRAAGEARVLGLNSVDPFSWQRGVARPRHLDALAGRIDPLAVNIVALHHPLEHAPGVDKQLPRGAVAALARMEAAGVRIVLTGHLHRWTTEALMSVTGHPRLLQVQSGTALCDRPGDLQNEVTMLDLAGDEVTITRHIAPMPETAFRRLAPLRLVCTGAGWRPPSAETR